MCSRLPDLRPLVPLHVDVQHGPLYITLQNIGVGALAYNESIEGNLVVYNVTIVEIRHGVLKKFLPMVIGCALRTAGSSIILIGMGNGMSLPTTGLQTFNQIFKKVDICDLFLYTVVTPAVLTSKI